MSNPIPLLRPSCTAQEINAVADVLMSGWWGMGAKCEEFERRLAEMYGMKHCVTLNSCTAALHLACLALDIDADDEVIVPALTFVSTALAPAYCGAKVVFADVKPETLTIDWDDVARKWTARTKAVIPVDYAGFPASDGMAKTTARTIIQDAAHSCGGIAYGKLVCLSFHPVKNLATGDGGAVLTNDGAIAARLRALRWCGIDRSTWERQRGRYGWDYDIRDVGYKCHWNDIQAAIGLVQLNRLGELNGRRREIAQTYTDHLADVCQVPPDHPNHTWHLYPIRVNAKERNHVIDHLASWNIAAGVHYKPLTRYPMFRNQATPPVTEREWRRLVSLPIFPDMTEDETAFVIKEVKFALRKKGAFAFGGIGRFGFARPVAEQEPR